MIRECVIGRRENKGRKLEGYPGVPFGNMGG